MSSPAIRQRKVSETAYRAAIDSGFTILQAQLIAARLPGLDHGVPQAISPTLSALDSYSDLPDIDIAASKIADAIQHRKNILIVVDHDVDGSSSMAILKNALCDFFMVAPIKVRTYASHRMREGYGVSDALVDRILAENKDPAIVITADQGSTDELRIARLLEHGIETVVTDHHEIPEAGIPKSAVAVVNPTRVDSVYPDRSIAGCFVAFLVMAAVRAELIARNVIRPSTPKLTGLIDFAAVGTVADCVDMSLSKNNRAVVRHGLYLMNTSPRPCWRAFSKALGKGQPITAETVGYVIGPRLNSSGRMDDSMDSVDFLLARNEDEASRLLLRLEEHNTNRRAIQDDMQAKAKPIAELQASQGNAAIVIYLPDGHAGSHGIVASRLVDAHGRPTVFISPKQGVEGMLTASLRSIDGVHIREALRRTQELSDGVTPVSFGGHRMAGGAALRGGDVQLFRECFNQAVAEQKDPAEMGPFVETDGVLPRAPDLQMLSEISALEPFGRQFPAPVFESLYTVTTIKPVGDGRHMKLTLRDEDGCQHAGIWFSAVDSAQSPAPLRVGQEAMFVYTLGANTYRGNTTLDLRVITAIPSEKELTQ